MPITMRYRRQFANTRKPCDLRGTNWDLVDYYGCADAEEVIVTMGSSAQTVQQTVDHLLKQGRKKSRGLDNSFCIDHFH